MPKRKRPLKKRDPPPSQPCFTSCFSPSAPSRGEQTHHPHPVISLYYNHVVTLRQYLLHQLPSSSKTRRRRILAKTLVDDRDAADRLAHLLDTTLVGVKDSIPPVDKSRHRDFTAFTQSQDRSQGTDTGAACPQSEVCYSPLPNLHTDSIRSSTLLYHLYSIVRGFHIKNLNIYWPGVSSEPLDRPPWRMAP